LFGQSSDTSTTATPEEPKGQCTTRIEEEVEAPIEEEKPEIIETPPSTTELSPDMSPDGTCYRQYVKTSDPIPIGSSHTVSGHEAMHLAKRLNEELAQQNSRSYGLNRAISPEPEARSKSYDHKSPQKGKGETKVKPVLFLLSRFNPAQCSVQFGLNYAILFVSWRS
jgi:inositol hexakisphosphate/diphosphoinositol-pentakisphosphate kinase